MRMGAGEHHRLAIAGPVAHDQLVQVNGAIGLHLDPRQRAVRRSPRTGGFHRGGDAGLLVGGDILPDDRMHQHARRPRRLRAVELLFDNSLGLICIHDMQGTLLSVNPAAARSLGYPVRALEQRALHTLMPVAG